MSMRSKHELILASGRGDQVAIALLNQDDCPWYIPQQTRRYLIRDANGRCAICGRTGDMQIDHKFPVSRGGKATYDNLQVLCRFCNLAKSNHVLDPKSYEAGYVMSVKLTPEWLITNRIMDILDDDRY